MISVSAGDAGKAHAAIDQTVFGSGTVMDQAHAENAVHRITPDRCQRLESLECF